VGDFLLPSISGVYQLILDRGPLSMIEDAGRPQNVMV
jgi:hypothetical protein